MKQDPGREREEATAVRTGTSNTVITESALDMWGKKSTPGRNSKCESSKVKSCPVCAGNSTEANGIGMK